MGVVPHARSTFYQVYQNGANAIGYCRQRLESTQRLVQPIPILGFVAEKIIEILIGVQTRYTYISGS
uniref:Uncharacterized protein n=1 Tax=Solanum lycopersicum TaxID=4081 RepID=A0A3Q7GZW6_SOLLC